MRVFVCVVCYRHVEWENTGVFSTVERAIESGRLFASKRDIGDYSINIAELTLDAGTDVIHSYKTINVESEDE